MKYNQLKKIIYFLCVSTSLIYSEQFKFDEVFNLKLTEKEKVQLSSGQVLIRNTKNSGNIVLKDYNDQTEYLISQVNQLNPSYLAEIIQIIPVNQNPDLISNINKVLLDIPSYKGIPYYSEHNKIWVDLYSKAKISNSSITGNETSISADFFMEPFGDISSDIKISKDQDRILYINCNTTPITYNGITCVKSNRMQSYIVVFKYNDYWILYGIGGVNAPRVPFLTERIELSFMNRIKTFCNFIFSKLI